MWLELFLYKLLGFLSISYFRVWTLESRWHQNQNCPVLTRLKWILFRVWDRSRPALWAICTQMEILRCSWGQRPVTLLGSIPPSDLMNWLSSKTSWKRGETSKLLLVRLPITPVIQSLPACECTHRVVVLVLKVPPVDGTLGRGVWRLWSCCNVQELSFNLTKDQCYNLVS